MSSAPHSASENQPAKDGAGRTTYPYRFGEVGIMMGVLDRDKVKESLNLQLDLKNKQKAEMIGQIMISKGWLDQKTVDAILVAQKRFRAKQEAGGGSSHASAQSTEGKKVKRSSKKKLGPYELRKKLGEGSMGAVFEAFDTESKRIVALKVLPKDLAGDREFLERFKREVKTMAALSHPNIVSFYESGQASGYWYLTMEYIEGGSLYGRLKQKGRMPEKEALRIVSEIAKALAYAHQQALIHRDIKPENILFSLDGTVKVTDFGLAKQQEDTSKLTAVGMSIGTPHYLSPEQAMGSDKVDHRADLYSLGATLFHLLTGKVPFDHVSSTRVMVMHVQDPPPDPRSIVPSISRAASKLVLRLMSKNPDGRFESATELLAAIEKVRKGGQLSAGSSTDGIEGVDSNKRGKKSLMRYANGCLGRAGLFALAIAALLAYFIP